MTASPMLASVIRSHSDCSAQLLARRAGARGGCSGRSAGRRSGAARSSSSSAAISRLRGFPPRARCRARARGSSRTPCRGSSTCRRRTARTRSRRVVPSCSTGMYSAASRTRSRTSSGVSTRGSIGRDDADEDPLVRLHVLADDLQDADAVLLARQGDVEVARPSARTGWAAARRNRRPPLWVESRSPPGQVCTPMRCAVLGGEPRQGQVVQVDEAVQQVAGRVDLDRQPPLGEVDLHLVRALPQAGADLGLVLAQQVVDELLARSSRGSRRPGT